MTAPIPSWPGVLASGLPLLAATVLLAVLRLGQVRPMIVSVARMVGQLVLLGYLMDWLFGSPYPRVVGASAALAMLLTSTQTVGSRVRGGGWPIRLEAFAAMAAGTLIVAAVAVRLALRVEPWYEPRVVIPLLGMILGNSVTGVALAAERLQSDLRRDRDAVELRLALGASTLQAAMPALRSAVAAGLTPVLNNMAIAGIVAIPGMTTGQLLVGASVHDAIRYQILIYLAITGTVALSTLALLAVRLRHYFTGSAQLRFDRLSDEPRADRAA